MRPEHLIALALVAASVLYGLATIRVGRAGVTEASIYCFFAGIAATALALESPLDSIAHRRLAIHMVQHLLLVSVAAPLLVAGRPLDLAARALRRQLPAAFTTARWPLVVVVACTQVATLLVWHVPALYDAALRTDEVHGAEHLTIFATAFALWFVLSRVDGDTAGATVIALFIATLPTMALGFAMTFSETSWYAVYQRRVSDPVADQQLAGVVMWAFGGMAAVIGGVILFVQWLRRLEHMAPARTPVGVSPPSLVGAPIESPPC
jgi:putative membrane protein